MANLSSSRRSSSSSSFSSPRSMITATVSCPIPYQTHATHQIPIASRAISVEDAEVESARKWLCSSSLSSEEEGEAFDMLARAYQKQGKFFLAENTSLVGLETHCSDYMKNRLHHTLYGACEKQGVINKDTESELKIEK